MFGKIVILGVGLMGGSLAAALKQRQLASEIVGWGYREQSLRQAATMGIIDSWTLDLDVALDKAEIVVVCSPSRVAETLICEVAAKVPGSTAVTDVASVKANLQLALCCRFGAMPGNIVLAHPIAGSERSGVAAADPNLYVDHSIILTSDTKTDATALRKVTALWRGVGGVIETMTPSEHDQILAGTSHLPHLLAFNMISALAKLPTSHDVFKFAAGGLRDFTRIAASDPQMWAEIALANKDAILNMLSMFEGELSSLSQDIQSDDIDALLARFGAAKASRDYFSTVLASRHNKEDVQ